jgi:hypothetical protein
MPKSAALSPAPQANDSSVPLAQPTHARRSPTKAAKHGALVAQGQSGLSNLKSEARPLLIGAGIGAAVALSVVALRSKERPPTLALFANANPDFLSVLVKAAVFAIGRSSARNTFAGVVARAVGQAVTAK